MLRLFAMTLVLTACTSGVHDPCDAEADPVALEQGTAAGSASGVLALAEGTEEQTLSGPAFGDVGMALSVQWTGDTAAFRDTPPDADAHVCYDALRVPVDLGLTTADGQLDESWQVSLTATEPGVVTVVHEVGVETLRGTWRPRVDDLTDLRLRVRIQWTEEGSEGVLTAIGTPTGDGPDEVWDVAVWPG